MELTLLPLSGYIAIGIGITTRRPLELIRVLDHGLTPRQRTVRDIYFLLDYWMAMSAHEFQTCATKVLLPVMKRDHPNNLDAPAASARSPSERRASTWGYNSVSSCRSYSRATGPGTSA